MCRDSGENTSQLARPIGRKMGVRGMGKGSNLHRRLALFWSCMSRLVTQSGAFSVSYAGPVRGQWVTCLAAHRATSEADNNLYLDRSLVMARASASGEY